MESNSALHIQVKGVVQGVGFRPFVYGLATGLDLKGWVLNTSSGVVIEVEGPSSSLDEFLHDLVRKAPPLSRIEQIESHPIPQNGYARFEIHESKTEAGYVLISPDIATCKPCLDEIFNPDDRRYRYPFTNCTNCGPRFTIIQDVPYDRPLTTMAPFKMCPACQAEYEDPLNRRFHAQPNACPVCGPRVWLASARANDEVALTAPDKISSRSEVLKEAAQLLRSGAVLALKGLGGFHLACDATHPRSVQTLRERKRRPHKPLAVMMPDLEETRKHCVLAPEEESLLTSMSCPIVLLPWRPGSDIAEGVAPGNRYLGVMLPYTPLHHVLLHDVGKPLVMTSGNLSEEPIAQNNEEAWNRLHDLVDWFLFHNREIYARYDDSVWFVPAITKEKNQTIRLAQPLRRSRGYAPFPIKLPYFSRPVLACGPEIKNTFCMTRDQYAFVSQHIGDMENLETLDHFETSISVYERLFRLKPEAIIHDLHPDYLSTHYAKERASRDRLPLVGVQHHHAHIASCLVENGLTGPVIGVAMDGTGFGLDGQVWGGEWLIADLQGFRRIARLEPLPLPGGDAGIRNPGRVAIAYLYKLLGEIPALPFVSKLDDKELKTVRAQVEKKINLAMTSSAGRLFDVVAAMAGGPVRVTYEAQAAIEMEMISKELLESYPYGLHPDQQTMVWGDVEELPGAETSYEIGLKPLIKSVVDDVHAGKSFPEIGGKFHQTLAMIVAEVSQIISQNTGLENVALSGGCFQNRLLLHRTIEELRERGLHPLLHHDVPSNDGCISLGQAAIGHFVLRP
ncbi:MAG TPA: carbamoyltransferase HypF [Thermodesulfobacteriota bacterium]|nr:carbamoyltransferase HypF [Thermodesulfobacteriota bacterium]